MVVRIFMKSGEIVFLLATEAIVDRSKITIWTVELNKKVIDLPDENIDNIQIDGEYVYGGLHG